MEWKKMKVVSNRPLKNKKSKDCSLLLLYIIFLMQAHQKRKVFFFLWPGERSIHGGRFCSTFFHEIRVCFFSLC